ncbi:Aliphatic sulfonates import ATP-binding protein SsuB 2 [Thiomonas sp. X19]|uniref:ABC transporter ATP-binding protein n=1 Tax=Thiomonas sp. X19 TaxID=1050370 RepID=UPI000B6AFD53|nr:ATP-binding cassette domain-containing protein [Thiomonas sp. X19]SCC91973.1 Aliphatic sulfonates import ATP-binding protein SsuB 2 [Thiomonas sp. X19]
MTEGSLFPITLHGVGLRRGANWVLRDLDLQLERGGITALVGPNGAGKTSLLRLIHGLDVPSCGSLHFAGEAPPQDGMAYAAQAMVFAHTPLLRASVEDNLRLALSAASTHNRRALLDAALARAGLKEQAQQSAASLSSGQRQRLALARAWMLQPELLLLDEPCSHLDQQASAAILQDVQDLAVQGITVLLSTHRPEEIALAQRVLRLEHGRLQTNHEPHQPAPRHGGTDIQGEVSCSPAYACAPQA